MALARQELEGAPRSKYDKIADFEWLAHSAALALRRAAKSGKSNHSVESLLENAWAFVALGEATDLDWDSLSRPADGTLAHESAAGFTPTLLRDTLRGFLDGTAKPDELRDVAARIVFVAFRYPMTQMVSPSGQVGQRRRK